MTSAVLATVAEPASDPLLYGLPLPRVSTWFPMGHAVEVSTNSPMIEAVADALWSPCRKLTDCPPVRIRIAVSPHDARVPPKPALPRGQEHLVTIVHGAENFAVADLAQGFSFACLTRDVARDKSSVRWHFLEPLVYVMLAARHFAQVHASCVERNGRAVLLCGDAGAGKTCLAYACARAGWTLVSGDATQVLRSSDGKSVIGRPFSIRFRESARRLFPELESWPVRPGFSGKLDIEVETERLQIALAQQARASHVVFLNRVPAASKPLFAHMAAEEALAKLARVIVYGHKELRKQQRHSLRRLLELPVCRFTYSGLEDAERALRGLVE